MTLVATTTTAAQPALAGLLDDFGSDPSKIQQSTKTVEIVPAGPKKAESVIEPNLRSNYYYPTNKKRYLPRIKRCSDAIPEAATFIGNGDWEAAETFALKIADDVSSETPAKPVGKVHLKSHFLHLSLSCYTDGLAHAFVYQ